MNRYSLNYKGKRCFAPTMIILLFALFIYGLETYSQPSGAKPFVVKNMYLDGDASKGLDTAVFEKNPSRFVRGWSCVTGMSKNIDTAMHINTYHNYDVNSVTASKIYTNNHLRIYWSDFFGYSTPDKGVLQAQGLQFDPEITFYKNHDKYHYDEFKPRSGDTTGAVFGFKQIHPNIIFDGNYAVIKKNLISRDTILSKPCLDKELIKLDDALGSNCDGRQWYISISLKSLDTTKTNLSDTVLVIKIPYYTYRQVPGNPDATYLDTLRKYYVNFDEVAENSDQPYSLTLGNTTAFFQRTAKANKYDTMFAITKKMLSQYSDKIHEQIFII